MHFPFCLLLKVLVTINNESISIPAPNIHSIAFKMQHPLAITKGTAFGIVANDERHHNFVMT